MKRFSATGRHESEYKFCVTCCSYHKMGRECYIQILKQDQKQTEIRFAAFDFESTQENEVEPQSQKYRHDVNFACVHVFCSKCIREGKWKNNDPQGCEICGPTREHTWSATDGDYVLEKFVKWILYYLNPSYKTIAFSHYGGRYDMTLVLGEIYRQGALIPQIIRSGHKLYEICVEKTNYIAPTVFRDSYNLMPQPLAALVGAYDLSVADKPWFPHLYNCSTNYEISLEHLPDRKFYCPNNFSKEKLEQFEQWYEANKNTPFHLPQKLREYCCNDVEILKHALVAFRTQWMDITEGEDVLRNSMTIASSCMRFFRQKHLEKDSLALTLENGAERHDKQSTIALKFLKWYAREEGLELRHRDSQGGEYRHHYVDADGRKKTLRLDGFAQRSPPFRPLAIEVNGCAWHGCPTCFAGDVMCPNGRTAAANLEATQRREDIIRRDFFLVTVWECDIKQLLKNNISMKQFFNSTFGFGPLDPRDAYFGGRTGPLKMVCDLENSKEKSEISTYSLSTRSPTSTLVILSRIQT